MKRICSVRECTPTLVTKRNSFVPSIPTRGARMTPAETASRPPRSRAIASRRSSTRPSTCWATVGYDRLTMDAVAARAKASKATLYRRWTTKLNLVDRRPRRPEGRTRAGPTPAPCAATSRRRTAASAASPTPRPSPSSPASSPPSAATPSSPTPTAPEVLGPKIAHTIAIFERARVRGELRDDIDITLIGPALPGIVLHRFFMLGEAPTPDLIDRVLDQIILPAATTAAVGADRSTRTRRNPMSEQTQAPEAVEVTPQEHKRLALGTRPHLPRPADGGARLHHRQHRPAVHRQGPGHRPGQPAVDRHRLRA